LLKFDADVIKTLREMPILAPEIFFKKTEEPCGASFAPRHFPEDL
jgi:hypothetical protein